MPLPAHQLRALILNLSLLPALATATMAQPAPVPASAASPRLLLKSGLRLTHLVYLPGARSWQLLLPLSFGLEYRLHSRFSAYAQAEADVSAGRAPRGRRGAMLLTPGASIGLGARCYFNHPTAAPASTEPWGNYVALEASAAFAQPGSRRGRGSNVGRITPALFAFCGTQHRGPGRRLLYDLNAGLGIEAPPTYSAEAAIHPPWNVAAQVNLRVYVANRHRQARISRPQPHNAKRAAR